MATQRTSVKSSASSPDHWRSTMKTMTVIAICSDPDCGHWGHRDGESVSAVDNRIHECARQSKDDSARSARVAPSDVGKDKVRAVAGVPQRNQRQSVGAGLQHLLSPHGALHGNNDCCGRLQRFGGHHARGRRAHARPWGPPRSLGSRRSRSASPSMLKPKTARLMAMPGNTAIHGACSM